MRRPTVLISGAGIAGGTLAYWLNRQGWDVTVVERASGMRSSGSPVDVRGGAVAVAERMGVMDRIRAAGTAVRELRLVDAAGHRVGHVEMGALQQAAQRRDVELPRGDLAAILSDASHDSGEFIYGDWVAAAEQDADGVDVTLAGRGERRFDLLIGADGLHSGVRRLIWGDEREFVRHMGLYVATIVLDDWPAAAHEVVMYNEPGRLAALHPARGRALAALIFWRSEVDGLDHRDAMQHKRIVVEAYRGLGWVVPDLLDRVAAAAPESFYFDAVSQVRLDRWSNGRIGLVGDAASCVSLFGDGSSLAIEGAFTLAQQLGSRADDVSGAFRRYESSHRPRSEAKQRGMRSTAALLVPRTRGGIAMRNLATRLWPVVAAAGRLGHLKARSIAISHSTRPR